MLTSGLIADVRTNVSGFPMPLPKSAAAATRSNGATCSPATTGHFSRSQALAGPATPKPPRTIRMSFADQ